MENVGDSNAESTPNNVTKFETVSARSAKPITRPTILNKPDNNELVDVQNYSWNNNRFRSINRSFRKAVDKSFEVNNTQINPEENSDNYSNLNSNENKNIQKVDKKLYPITKRNTFWNTFTTCLNRLRKNRNSSKNNN
jgi:leucyl-tRNA synthetase